MTIEVKPKFTSEVEDSPVAEAAGMVTPSRWNDGSDLTMSSGYLVGRTTAGPGLAEEVGPSEVKAFIGLENVDNTSDAEKNIAVATLENKTIDASDNTILNLDTTMFATDVVDTDGTMAANSDLRVPTQKAVRTYISANAVEVSDIGTTVQAYDADLEAISDLVTSADKLPYATGSEAWALTSFTGAARNLLDDASSSDMRTTLGVVIGSDVQAYDADLEAISDLVSAADRVPYATGPGTWSLATFTSTGRSIVSSADTAAARAAIGSPEITSGVLFVPGTSSTSAEIRLFEDTDNGSNYTSLKSSSALGSSLTFVLPSDYGTDGQAIVSDGLGGLSFENVSSSSTVIYSEISSGSTLTAVEIGYYIGATGTFTVAFDPAATLGDGWWCYLKNIGTGDITLDPNSTETIDGLTTYVMYPGEARLIQCDGSVLRSVVLSPFAKSFTASGSFAKPPGYTHFGGLLWAGGGGGGKSNTGSWNAGGGGGGACVPFELPSSSFGTTETVTLGAGGTGSSIAGNGTVGGTSTLGSLLTAYGGGAGGGNASANRGGGGGGGAFSAGQAGANDATSATGGLPALISSTTALSEPNNHGFGGGAGIHGNAGASVYGGGGGSSNTGQGGKSVFGGGGGSGGAASPGTAGVSAIGGNGGIGGNAVSGTDGSAPAGGGGGTRTGTKGGDGARGELRIWGIA